EPIDARSLANRLGKYGIGSKTLRRGSVEVFKGYARSQFEDAWTRYVPIDDGKGDNEGDDDISEPPAPVERNSAVTSVTSVAAVPDVTAVTDPNLHARAGCHHRQMTTTAATNGHHQ
ncbi:DUF3631 domain-containing protein, partial [Mycobacterium montefiorense]